MTIRFWSYFCISWSHTLYVGKTSDPNLPVAWSSADLSPPGSCKPRRNQEDQLAVNHPSSARSTPTLFVPSICSGSENLRNFPGQVSPAKTLVKPPEFLTEIPRRQIPCLKRACIPSDVWINHSQRLPIRATQRALRLCLSFSSRRILSPSSMACLSFSFSDSRFEHFEPKHIPAPGELGPLLTTNDH